MNICDNPTRVSIAQGWRDNDVIQRIPIIVTGALRRVGKIVTQVEPFKQFYKAENYHQDYFKLHGEQPYCQLVIAPKIAKFRKLFHDQLN